MELLLEKGTPNINNKKQVDSQQFLFLNILVLIVFMFWFLSGRRNSQRKPTTLNLKRGGPTPGGVLQTPPEKSSERVPEKITSNVNDPFVNTTAGGSKYRHPKYQKYLDTEAMKPGGEPKELNVLFNYNGHTWDAYEVLGVPAGADLVAVTKAYQEMLRRADPESHPYLETAYRAILAKT